MRRMSRERQSTFSARQRDMSSVPWCRKSTLSLIFPHIAKSWRGQVGLASKPRLACRGHIVTLKHKTLGRMSKPAVLRFYGFCFG